MRLITSTLIYLQAISVMGLFAGFSLPGDAAALEINIGTNNTVNTNTIVGDCKKGNGKIRKQQRQVAPFNTLTVDGVFTLRVVAGDHYSVEVGGDENLLEHIETTVDGDNLLLTTSGSYCTTNEFTVNVTVTSLESITADGASDIDVDFRTIEPPSLHIDLNGTSTLKIMGATPQLRVSLQGTAELTATEFKSTVAHVETGDATVARLYVSEKLTGVSSGASEIHYMGQPQIVEAVAEDAGEVAPIE